MNKQIKGLTPEEEKEFDERFKHSQKEHCHSSYHIGNLCECDCEDCNKAMTNYELVRNFVDYSAIKSYISKLLHKREEAWKKKLEDNIRKYQFHYVIEPDELERVADWVEKKQEYMERYYFMELGLKVKDEKTFRQDFLKDENPERLKKIVTVYILKPEIFPLLSDTQNKKNHE
jgi:hypothetical protein